MAREILSTIALLAIATQGTRPCAAQCTFDWYPGAPLAGVGRDSVDSFLEWDPDGDGPQNPVLFVGGKFTVAGSVSTVNIAIWNGSSWSNAGQGLGVGTASGGVYSMTSWNGQVVAGGAFTIGATVQRIARWNGSQWNPFTPGFDNTVRSVAVYNGELIAAGYFLGTFPATAPLIRIARWNGSAWQQLGGGLNNRVNALCVYKGELIAAGGFNGSGPSNPVNRIARWNGSKWAPLGQGSPGDFQTPDVRALCEYNGELIASGDFSAAAGPAAAHIARWDGESWKALGEGTQYDLDHLIVWNNKLIGCGDSPAIITSWDGSTWANMPAGFGGGFLYMNSIGIFGGQLFAGGNFTIPGNNIARLNGNTWEKVSDGNNDWIYSLCEHQGSMYLGGIFRSVGNIDATRIAQWTPGAKEEWRPLGAGVNGLVFKMLSNGNDLIAAGSFTEADGIPVGGIARWDGKSFSPLGTGFEGGAPPTAVYCLAEFNGKIIAGGRFTNAGSKVVKYIASWDGSEWSDLGGGMNDSVISLAVWNGSLYAGGFFTTAGDVPVRRIARWDGSNWYPVAEGCDHAVYALHVYNNHLIAGGQLLEDGYSILSRWNGSTWTNFDIESPNFVNGLTTYNGDLIVAGNFTAGQIQRYNQNWIESGLGTGLEYSQSWVVTPYRNELIVGGKFIRAGGKGTGFFARWHPAYPRGDMNCDNHLDASDINSFVNVIIAPETSTVCQRYLADMNGDGNADGLDIAPFVAPLSATGACCAVDGTCQDGVSEFTCTSQTGAIYQGDNTNCATANCPAPGACCAVDGTCQDGVSQITCTSQTGAIFQGDNTNCATANCPLAGACINSQTGVCSTLTQAACTAGGGVYQGDNSTCPVTVYENSTSSPASFQVSALTGRLADDITLAGTARNLRTVELGVGSTAASGTFNVTATLYTACPGQGGVAIPNASWTWNGIPRDGAGHTVSALLTTSITIPDTLWIVAQFSVAQAGWIKSGQAEIGSTQNIYGVSFPEWLCDLSYSGGNHAGFWVKLGCTNSTRPSGESPGSEENNNMTAPRVDLKIRPLSDITIHSEDDPP